MVSKNKLFISFSLFLLSAIFLYNLSYNSILGGGRASLGILFLLCTIFIAYYIWKRKYTIFILVSCLAFGIGIVIAHLNMVNIEEKNKTLENYFSNEKQEITLEITDTYKIKDYSNEYIAKVIKINTSDVSKNIKSLIRVPSNFELKKGYIITASTKLIPLINSPEFHYKSYMVSKNIFFKAYINYYETKSIQTLNPIEKYIRKIRKKVLNIIEKLYPKEEGIFLGGILIGARENLPNDLKINFNNSGLTHFIAVSGFNITILVVFLTYILKYFPIPIRIFSITIAIGLFTILVGDTAPVIRASIMGLIGYYILVSGRQGNGLSIMLLTAMIMVIISPLSINYDVSLHLSFLAVIGIMYTQNFFMKVFSFLPDLLEIKTAFVLTLAALSFTLPIMVFNFGQVSIMAPFANIAVTWTIPIAMLLGFLSIVVYFVYPLFGIIIAYLTWIFLKWDILIVHFFGKLDWSILEIDLGIYKNHAQILYFALLIFLILWFHKKEETH